MNINPNDSSKEKQMKTDKSRKKKTLVCSSQNLLQKVNFYEKIIGNKDLAYEAILNDFGILQVYDLNGM